jgi:hypothetical protein
MKEGYLKKQSNGRYAIEGAEFTCGERIEVKIEEKWIPMRFEHDGDDYYLLTEGFSFYPKNIYVRTIEYHRLF